MTFYLPECEKKILAGEPFIGLQFERVVLNHRIWALLLRELKQDFSNIFIAFVSYEI
jgi:hypothetical protein